MAFWNRNRKIPAHDAVQSQAAWHRSRAHLFLLTKFRGVAARSVFDTAGQYWAPLLKEPPADAIQRFIDEGMIEKAGLAEILTNHYTADALKTILKKHGLPVNGTKSKLAERLVTNCEQLMRNETAGLDYWRCSTSGLEIPDAYSAQEKQCRDKAMSESMVAFRGGDIRRAVLVAAQYDQTQLFARNIHVDETENDLKTISTGNPGILKSIDSQRMDALRTATAMMYLWNERDTRPWLPPDWTSGIHIDGGTSARMLHFYALHEKRMQEMRENGYKKVEVIACLDIDTCAACMKIHERKLRVSIGLELPNPNCTSPAGCRCEAIPVE